MRVRGGGGGGGVCARARVCGLRLNFLFTPVLVEGVEVSGSVCGGGGVCLSLAFLFTFVGALCIVYCVCVCA